MSIAAMASAALPSAPAVHAKSAAQVNKCGELRSPRYLARSSNGRHEVAHHSSELPRRAGIRMTMERLVALVLPSTTPSTSTISALAPLEHFLRLAPL